MSHAKDGPKHFEEVSLLRQEEGLSEKEDLSLDRVRHQKRYYCINKTTASALTSLFLAIILIITVIAVATQRKPSRKGPFDPAARGALVDMTPGCGNNPSEAKANGCIFDVMNYAWTRPECYDEGASKEALSRGPWKWYLDANATQPLEGQDLERLAFETEVWTEHSYHVAHCLYSLKLVHRAGMSGQWMLKEVGSWNHTLHCDDLLMKTGTEGALVNTWVRTLYQPCVKFAKD